MIPLKWFLVFWFLALLSVTLPAQTVDAGKRTFAGLCAGCHGSHGTGGERGPDIMSAWQGRRRSMEDLREFIRKGKPEAGMPAFDLGDEQLDNLAAFVGTLVTPAAEQPAPGDRRAGEAFFFGRGKCSQCHTVNMRGRLLGPDL